MLRKIEAPIRQVDVAVYKIPTDLPEADGTYSWDSTTLVLVEAAAGDEVGMGYTYADLATAQLIRATLADVAVDRDALAISGTWEAMRRAVRNLGQPGISAMAISALDAALWDLKARLLGLPLVALLGACREAAPVYGSGGFTSYSDEQLAAQLNGWVGAGIPRVKMKIGSQPERDLRRVQVARRAIGPAAALFVDANGAYSRKQALLFAEQFAEYGVRWFEEPVSSDDLDGLRLLRDRAPAGMEIAAGEYGYTPGYFRRMLDAGAVDVLQADASRCLGISGFLDAAALCEAAHMPLSAHCAPSLHVHLGCAVRPFRHMEYFHDHARIEHMLFEGALDPVDGALYPDLTKPGLGLELRRQDAAQWQIA